MDTIAELERRITAALERISATVEHRLSAAPAAPVTDQAELDRLRADLDEERQTSARLADTLKSQRDRSERAEAGLAEEVTRLTAQVDAQALAMQKLVTATVQMREELRRLRDAAEAGPVDSALIDKAMAAELEAFRATRAAETAELDDLIAVLTPIVEAEEAREHA